MINFKIDYAKTYLPAALRKGDSAARLKKALEMNTEFSKNIQYCLSHGDIPGKTFKRMIHAYKRRKCTAISEKT